MQYFIGAFLIETNCVVLCHYVHILWVYVQYHHRLIYLHLPKDPKNKDSTVTEGRRREKKKNGKFGLYMFIFFFLLEHGISPIRTSYE